MDSERVIQSLQKAVADLQNSDRSKARIAELVEENAKQKNEINIMKYNMVSLQESADLAEKECKNETDAKMALIEKHRALRKEYEDLLHFKREYMDKNKSSIDKLYAKFSECKEAVAMVKRLQERTAGLETRIEELTEENRRLGVRAAVGFEELTPRYGGLEKAFEELGLDLPQPEKVGEARVSSCGYIRGLIKAAGDIKKMKSHKLSKTSAAQSPAK